MLYYIILRYISKRELDVYLWKMKKKIQLLI